MWGCWLHAKARFVRWNTLLADRGCVQPGAGGAGTILPASGPHRLHAGTDTLQPALDACASKLTVQLTDISSA